VIGAANDARRAATYAPAARYITHDYASGLSSSRSIDGGKTHLRDWDIAAGSSLATLAKPAQRRSCGCGRPDAVVPLLVILRAGPGSCALGCFGACCPLSSSLTSATAPIYVLTSSKPPLATTQDSMCDSVFLVPNGTIVDCRSGKASHARCSLRRPCERPFLCSCNSSLAATDCRIRGSALSWLRAGLNSAKRGSSAFDMYWEGRWRTCVPLR
jgi:hypothetical protein